MLICKDCGTVFSESEVSYYEENAGEFWGHPCTQKMACCPNCGGDFVQAKQCGICKEWISEEEFDICEECLSQFYTEENCLEIGEYNATEIKINEFLAIAFSEDEVVQILIHYLHQDPKRLEKAIKNYCDCDKSYFVEWVVEKWNKEK